MQQRLFGILSRSRLFGFAITSIILTFIILYTLAKYLTVQDVEVYTDNKSIEIRGIDKIKGMLLLGQKEQIEERLKSLNPILESVYVDTSTLGRTKIYVDLASEVAYMSDGDSYIILSDKAKIVMREYERPKSLGEMIVSETHIVRPLVVGHYIASSDVKFGAKVAKVFANNAITAFRINVIDSNLIQTSLPTSDIIIKMSNDSTSNLALTKLDEFLQRLYTTSTGKNIKELDLRFGKAVIYDK